jgi:two-component system response regulator HydG
VYGESGTGKEFIVRMIHDQSSRAGQAYVSVNCAALPEPLLESELFGHVRGAFTGAVRDKIGLFESATAGTLFLDEIGEMAPTIQAKLLRALQEGEIRRVGGERSIRVNPRVIAATNRDLRAAVEAGGFREDLYFRLSAFVINVPPLRDRREEIPVLVQQFVRAAAKQLKKDVRGVSAEAMTLLMNYRWPGNVRELEHAIQRGVILSQGRSVTVRELPPEVRSGTPGRSEDDTLNLDENEEKVIRLALERFRWNRRRTAKALNISTATLWRRMKRYGLHEPRSESADSE